MRERGRERGGSERERERGGGGIKAYMRHYCDCLLQHFLVRHKQ